MIAFTEEMTTALNNSFSDRKIVQVGSASPSGTPDIAYKGSAMAWDGEHIAFWERALGTTYSNLKANPQCVLLYTNFEERKFWKFTGMAEVLDSGEVRDAVMARTVQAELDRDPERKGAAVVVRIDKVTMGPTVLQER